MPKNVTAIPKRQSLDDETAAALTLYNTYLVADREQQAHERALTKAQKAKDDAAATVRKLNDRKASAEETAKAEAQYREAVEALQRLRDGETARPQGSDDGGDESASDAGAEDTDSDEDAPSEKAEDTDSDEDAPSEKAEDTDSEKADEAPSVGVEASVGDEDLAGDEPAGVAG